MYIVLNLNTENGLESLPNLVCLKMIPPLDVNAIIIEIIIIGIMPSTANITPKIKSNALLKKELYIISSPIS